MLPITGGTNNGCGVNVLNKYGVSAFARALQSPQRRARRTYAVAAITDMAATISHDEITALCHIAAEIVDEKGKRMQSEEE